MTDPYEALVALAERERDLVEAGRYEELVALDEPDRTTAVLAGTTLGDEARTLLRALLAADLT